MVKTSFVADGRKQREDADPIAVTSPTVATESVFITGAIAAKEGRDVATMDFLVVYLWADQDELIHMHLRGKLVELPVLAAPKLYSPSIQIGKDGKPILYVRLLKAFHRCLRSALKFYRKLLKDLETMGCVLNPYDLYMVNHTVKGTQTIIC